MSNIINTQNKEQLTLDSREVAEMVGKRHTDLLRDIDIYIQYLNQNADLRFDDFFVESNYKAGTGKKYKCYQITKKGCELIAHKLTGQKGVVFTATYINRFHEMENRLIQTQINHTKFLIQQQRIDVMLMNAKTRQAKLIKDILQNIKLPREYAKKLAYRLTSLLVNECVLELEEIVEPVNDHDISRILAYIAKKLNGATKRDIARAVNLSGEEVQEILNELLESKKIKSKYYKPHRGRPTIKYFVENYFVN